MPAVVILKFAGKYMSIPPVDTVRKLNVHKTLIGHLLNVLCRFYLRPLKYFEHLRIKAAIKMYTSQSHHVKQNILTTIKVKNIRPEKLTEIDLLIRNSAKENSQ